MRGLKRRSAAWLVISLGALTTPWATPPARTAAPATARTRPLQPPKLVVVISVDGLSWPRLAYYRPWYVAGFQRLLKEGLVETSCRYRHLNTETGPGHSALSTGAPPRVTGIVANRWFEEGPDKRIRIVNCVEQRPAADRAGTATDPPEGEPIRGPANLRVPTLADRLVQAHPDSRVISISAKDRSAILLAGRVRSHAVYWLGPDTGKFVTSSAYDPQPAIRKIVADFNKTRAGAMLPSRFGLAWRRLAPAPNEPGAPSARPAPAPAMDLYDFQIPSNGLGFDHPLTVNPNGYYESLYISPAPDDLVADLALAFLEDDRLRLGRTDTPDILLLSFSAHDVVSHSYGNESEEELDVLRRLDLHLGRLLATLERLDTARSSVIALSADHGFFVIPEAERKRDKAFVGGRLVNSERTKPNFLDRLNVFLDDELCLDAAVRPVFAAEGWNLVYARDALPFKTVLGRCGPPGKPVTADDVDNALVNVVGRFYKQEIEEVLLVSQRDRWPATDPATEFARNDFDPERSGDAFLIPRPGVIMHWDPARGSGHGSHYDYDTHVPLIFWGGAFKSAESDEETTPYDLAPTLAQLLGLELPDAVGISRLPRSPSGPK